MKPTQASSPIQFLKETYASDNYILSRLNNKRYNKYHGISIANYDELVKAFTENDFAKTEHKLKILATNILYVSYHYSRWNWFKILANK